MKRYLRNNDLSKFPSLLKIQLLKNDIPKANKTQLGEIDRQICKKHENMKITKEH